MNATITNDLASNLTAEENETHGSYKVSDLRKAFGAVKNPEGWKKPWTAAVHHSLVAITGVASNYFLGSKITIEGIQAGTGYVILSSSGYAY